MRFEVQCFRSWVWGLGFGVWGWGFKVLGVGVGVAGSRCWPATAASHPCPDGYTKVDIRLHGKVNSNSHSARPVY